MDTIVTQVQKRHQCVHSSSEPHSVGFSKGPVVYVHHYAITVHGSTVFSAGAKLTFFTPLSVTVNSASEVLPFR